MRGGQMMPLHKLLGENFAGFKHRRALRWTKDAHASTDQLIDQAKTKWNFRADDGQVRLLSDGHSNEVVKIFLIDRDAAGKGRDAAVSRRTDHLLYARRASDGPDQCVFAAATTDDKNLHAYT
jgi:hypothetical protein